MPLQDTPFGVFAAAYGAYLLLGLLGQRAGEVLMGRWRAGLDVGFLSTSKRKVHVSPQVFSTSRMEPRCCSTTMVFWSSSDAPGNLLLQVFPNDAQCQVLPRIFCLNISHFQQDMHQPMVWWIFQPKHVTRGGCLENWGCHSSTCWWLVGQPDDQLANTEVDSQPLHVPVALRMLKIIPQLNLLHNTHFFPDNQKIERHFAKLDFGFQGVILGMAGYPIPCSWPSPPSVGQAPAALACCHGTVLKEWPWRVGYAWKWCTSIWEGTSPLDESKNVDWWVEELMCIYFFCVRWCVKP